MFRRLALVSILALSAAAEEDALRELVDRVRDIEAQIALIERESALPAERTALWTGAMRGLAQAADPHAAYLAPDEVAVHGLSTEPLRHGLGFDWLPDADGARITRVVPGSPAARAGIHPGCRLLSVDDVPAARTRAFAEALARGPDAKRLVVQDVDGGQDALALTRAELADDGIARAAEAAPGILHVRIGRFMPAADAEQPETATAAAFRRQLAAVPELRAVVLDLRGCSGGTLQAAVEIAAGWLPPGATVIEQIGRGPARTRAWSAPAPRLPQVPVAVLVDEGTASAAEVLALALQRQRRSPLIGTPTRGKWTAQQVFLLPRGDAIQLTVAILVPPGTDAPAGPLQPGVLLPQEVATTWRRWRAELAGTTPLPPDPQLSRAVEVASVLAQVAR